ncbi:MAG: family 10 glycosylhydrolase, partial [Cyanobacteria bacterium P01_G01_bin.49]
HAWVWTFATGNQAHNRLLNQPANYMGPVLNAHPDWANYDNRGEVIPPGQTKPFLDPANPEVRGYLLSLLQEIASNYDVDGIQLDYIRYPFQDPGANRTYGYGLASRQQFKHMTGVDPLTLSPGDNPQQWSQWTQFRSQQVSSFVAEASQTLKRLRPGLIVSTAVFAQPTHERLQKLQQDWESWARQGSVDWIVLMSYAADTQRFDELIRPWVIEANYGSTLVIPGIRLNTSQLAALDQIRALRDLPTAGYALFAAEYLDQGLQSVLNATQGPSATLRSHPLPQRRPFAAAAARYQSLQREWNWLLSHQQIQINERNFQQLVREANALGEELDRLSDDASHRDLVRVRSRLDRLRTQLNTDVTVRTASRHYRLRAWQHRLSAIERLLTYGENRF